MLMILLVVLGIIAIIVLNILKAQNVSLPGVRPPARWDGRWWVAGGRRRAAVECGSSCAH